MRIYKLTISYDGSRYDGWARQVMTDNTIQYVLEWSFSRIVGFRVNVEGAADTETGAHAREQIATVSLDRLYDTDELKDAINGYLPEDIRVNKVELAEEGFGAKSSARAVKYEYYIDCREKPDVFSRRYCYHCTTRLDMNAMKAAIPYLLGPKNFSSFTTEKYCENPFCNLMNIKIVRSGEKIRITYYGTEFLKGMVGILSGTLIEIGTGRRDASKLPGIIAAENPRMAGFEAPARGIFLRKIYY